MKEMLLQPVAVVVCGNCVDVQLAVRVQRALAVFLGRHNPRNRLLNFNDLLAVGVPKALAVFIRRYNPRHRLLDFFHGLFVVSVVHLRWTH